MRNCEDNGGVAFGPAKSTEKVLPPTKVDRPPIVQSHQIVTVNFLEDGSFERIVQELDAPTESSQSQKYLKDSGRLPGGQITSAKTLFFDDGMAKHVPNPVEHIPSIEDGM